MSSNEAEDIKRGGIMLLREGNYPQWAPITKAELSQKELWYLVNPLVAPQSDHESKEDKFNQKAINDKHDTQMKVKAALKNDLKRLMDGKEELEGDARTRLMEWRLDNDKKTFVAIIIKVCDAVNVARIKDIEEPSYVWNELGKHHKNATNENVGNILAEIRATHHQGSMQDYLNVQRGLYDALLLAGGTMTEHAFCLMVVRNLSQDFDVQAGMLSASSNLKWGSVEIALKTAYETFVQRKAHRAAVNRTKNSSSKLYSAENSELDAAVQRAVAKAIASKKKKSKQGICFHFANHGRCRYGDDCRFKHVSSDMKRKKKKNGATKTEAPGYSSSSDSDSEN